MARLVLIPVLLLAAVLTLPGGAHARVPSGFVGMTSEDLGSIFMSEAQRKQTMAAQRRAGVRLVRQTFEWAFIERAPGARGAPPRYPLPGYRLPGPALARYNWVLQDRIVLGAARARIRVLPVLFNPPGFHTARPRGDRNVHPPRDNASMAAFASAAVARYGPGGSLWHENKGVRPLPIRSWQVWNEPSLRPYWGGKPNAKSYVAMLKAVYTAIKRRDRRAEVVTAGIPPSLLSGSVPIKKFIDQMYKAGGKRYFDTLAVNSYARSARELQRLLRSVRKIMNRRRDRRARIWITELGWCDRGPKNRFCVGARKQAALIRSSLKLIRKERVKLRLRGFVYFGWRDGRPYAPEFRDLWGLHTGLLKLNGKPKPALRVFKRGARVFR